MADLTGKTIGKYQLTERLGRGGMAEVYKAYQPSLDRYIAVKILHSHLMDEAGFIGRFQREARAVANLHHSNIVQIYDFDVDLGNDIHFMVMEYLDGVTLKARLDEQHRRQERLAASEVIRIFDGILGGIGYAHAQGMVHRDLKPANIMFDSQGRPVITDFGIAKIVGGTRYTASGTIMGTPAYMSPEQGQGAPGDERSDLYALGVVLYECLTGQVPYDADTPVAVLLKHITEPVPVLRQGFPDLPDALERVVLKAMAKNPDDRYQTAAEFRAALGQVTREQSRETFAGLTPVPAYAPAEPTAVTATPRPAAPTTAVAPPPARRRALWPPSPRLWVGLAAVMLLAIVSALAVPRLFGPSPAEKAAAEAQAYAAQGNYPLALATFNRALAAEPQFVPALLGRAEAYVYLGQPDSALLDAERAVQVAPDSAAALLSLARLKLQFEPDIDVDAILADIETAIALAPESPDGYYTRGWARLNFADDPDGAVGDLETAAQLDPEDAEYQHQLGDALYFTGGYEAALEALDRAVTLKPAEAHYYVERARVNYALRDLFAALKDIQQAIELDSTQAAYYSTLGFIRHERLEYSDAIAAANEALARDPDLAAALYVRGLANFQLERYEAALQDYDLVLQHAPGEYDQFLNPDNEYEIYVDRGQTLAAMGRAEEGLASFGEAIRLFPDWFLPYYLRAQAYADQEAKAQAIDDYEQVLALTPDQDYRDLAQKALDALR